MEIRRAQLADVRRVRALRLRALESDPDAFGETPDLMAIVTLPTDQHARATANLRAPLLIDWTSRTGMQLIGVDDAWSTAHPFDLAALLH